MNYLIGASIGAIIALAYLSYGGLAAYIMLLVFFIGFYAGWGERNSDKEN